MKKLLFLLCLTGILAGHAEARARSYGYCMQGGTSFNVSGLQVNPLGQGSYPGCTVEVFLTGTLIHPTNIYSDNAGTVKANPFTADTTTGLWFWYADNNRYDVKLSGGNPSPGLGAGFTLGDIVLVDTATLGFSTYFSAPFSSTPVFNLTNGNIQAMTLTGNVTSSTTINQIVGSRLELVLCQDGVGGRTVVFPASFVDVFTVATGPNQCSEGEWYFNGVSWKLFGNPMVGSPLTTLTANTWVALQTFSVVPAFPSQLTNLIFASPCGSSGVPSFRSACAADFPLVNITSGAAGGVFSAGTTAGHVATFASNNGPLTDGGAPSTMTTFSYSSTGLFPLMTSNVTNPSTTPNLNQTATTVAPGQFLRGPVPTGSTTNPSFENSTVNASSVNGTTVSVTGTPATATSVALFFGSTGTGQAVPVPDGTWTDFPVAIGSSSSKPHYKNIVSGAPLTASSTIGGSDSWSSSIAFLGGTITSIPQNVTLTNTCGTGCATGSLGAVTGGHTIIVFGYWASGSIIPSDVRAVDSVGNGYFLALFAPNLGTNGHFALIAQNVAAGTPTITVNTSKSLNFSGVVAFDLAGPTAYFTGPNGPYGFGYITQADLLNAGVQTTQVFGNSTVGGDIAVSATTITTITSVTVKTPAVGCPCRLFASYSAYINTASSGVGYNVWLTDGSNTWGQTSQGQSNGSSGALVSNSWSGLSPTLYGSGASVTVTLTTFGDHTYTVKSQSPVSGTLANGPVLTSLQVSVQTSN